MQCHRDGLCLGKDQVCHTSLHGENAFKSKGGIINLARIIPWGKPSCQVQLHMLSAPERSALRGPGCSITLLQAAPGVSPWSVPPWLLWRCWRTQARRLYLHAQMGCEDLTSHPKAVGAQHPDPASAAPKQGAASLRFSNPAQERSCSTKTPSS